jgi:hypothetical protein
MMPAFEARKTEARGSVSEVQNDPMGDSHEYNS